ncbi:Cytochrome P450 [Cordyceps fumosorosea ARSEF 2679]|uniref:Cytochrome P450 monooxygenase fumoA n=1 Tax=Cordyceps fumosorosea (strain ARSEF 2679) TaxID=1081104 RepID=FUMOA_CORFA|nr:Cytochrome P450 [Cordyceps fumosorosea ARSEF 2679]A0A167LUS5.1 RecName: Full=Cytochrome P450 monooxygenase fumoA; AltName: Full=Fumosorinone biosynthesis cluster protein A [Cordyceps fumosorosea ARSEF 2679]AKC54420.1 cytochrome P450 monooxygenase [Cordyceps fumosorosea]OAA53532.1 Cytochrome P450 [Cordyceps fumosorosea ARSEF 2679]
MVATLANLNFPYLILSACLSAILLSRFLPFTRRDRRPTAKGCLPEPRVFQWDVFFGLDIPISQGRALQQNRYLEWLRDLHASMPRTKTFSVNFGGYRWIYSIEPEILKAVYATNFQDFGVEPIRQHPPGFKPFAEKGVSTSDGEDWAFSRSLIKPFFERSVYVSTDRVKPFADKFLTFIPEDGETFDIQPLLQRWFLDMTSEFIFGKSQDSMTHPERAEVIWAMADVLRGTRLRAQTYKILWAFNWDWWFKAIEKVHGFLNPYIRSTLAELAERQQRVKEGLPVGEERTDLLWSMATMLPEEEALRSQVCIIFVPNNDTTSIFIAHCLYFLARHPDAWRKLREEVTAVGDAPITFELLRNMKYLNGIMNETHRLIPNNVTQIRSALSDVVLPLGGGPDGKAPLDVRKGDIVSVTKTVMYRDPDRWGADADEYRPERWDGMRGGWHFLPYGGGPRRCPAQMMVQNESGYMLCRLARRYARIEARDKEPYRARMRIGPSSLHGVKIAFYKE